MNNFISIIQSTGNIFIGQIAGNQTDGAFKKLKAFWNGEFFGMFSAGYLPAYINAVGNHRVKGEDRNVVIIPLPVSTFVESGILRLEEDEGTRFFETSFRIQQAKRANGPVSSDMLRLQKYPLAKVQYAKMEDGCLQLYGFAQTAFSIGERITFADRAGITINADPGLKISFDPFVPSAGHSATFWYFPDADYSGVRVDVDLGGSICDKPEFEFYLDLGKNCPDKLGQTTFVPLDMRRYMNYPNQERMRRVQSFDDVMSITISGYTDARRLREIFRMHGMDLRGKRILDWGCGHGRVWRHFMMDGDLERVAGIDIDPDNIGWARTALLNGDFHVGPLMPPTGFADASFDAIYGISVMTHLAPDIQAVWLTEIRRMLKPGGLALLTFTGAPSVAYGSQFYSSDWLDEWGAEGVNATTYDEFDAVLGVKNYYQNVFMTDAYMSDLWSRYMSIEAVYEIMFGYQSLTVLRK